MSNLEVNGRVKHKSLGNGTITNTNREMTEVFFDNNTTKTFQTFKLLDKTYFVDAEDRIDKNIKIELITVKNLFDRLDYEIGINTKNNVAIFTAPNGCGKTTIFKLANFLFNPNFEDFEEIKSIPFTTFSCTLNNLKTVTLSHSGEKNERSDLILKISSGQTKIVEISINEMLSGKNDLEFYDFYINAEDELNNSEYFTGMGLSRKRKAISNIYEVLKKQGCNLRLDFIEANRLQKTYYPSKPRNAKVHNNFVYNKIQQGEPEKIDFINKASEEMAEKISIWLLAYNRKLTDAKNRLTLMYLDVGEDPQTDFESFKKRWDTYHRELKKFYEIGLLESTETVIEPSKLKDAYENKASFLNTYLDAFEGTLEPLLENYDKLKLFADIFDKRNKITQKTIKFSPTGIKVFSGEMDNRNEIRIDCLSSGEKNDFVMFYRLIFNTSKYGTVLIDEPEISLHIEWQEEYLDRLLDICKMNDLQAIVATHSPNIINGHLDLFVDKR